MVSTAGRRKCNFVLYSSCYLHGPTPSIHLQNQGGSWWAARRQKEASGLCDTSSLPDNQLQQELAAKTKQNPLPIHINNNQYSFQQWQKIRENRRHWDNQHKYSPIDCLSVCPLANLLNLHYSLWTALKDNLEINFDQSSLAVAVCDVSSATAHKPAWWIQTNSDVKSCHWSSAVFRQMPCLGKQDLVRHSYLPKSSDREQILKDIWPEIPPTAATI